MKVFPFQIPKPTNDALIYQEDHEFEFYNQLHQHEEIQLSCIVKGEGTLLVGDSLHSYQSGDVFAIGGNLPHVFLSASGSAEKSVMYSLFFTKESFGEHFFDLEELQSTKGFFRTIDNGFQALSKTKNLANQFLSLQSKSRLQRFVSLLEIVEILSKSKKRNLSNQLFKKRFSTHEGQRMRDVMDFTFSNYQNEIRIDTISDIAHMTTNAFCKYFKKRTNKTYNQFLNELRIEKACQLLLIKDKLVSEIAFETGFPNLSNFNRKFKNIKGITPSKFRNSN